MKKPCTLIAIILTIITFSVKVNAQITINAAAPSAGNAYANAHDTTSAQLTSYTPGAKGANVTWDFHTVPLVYTDNTTFALPSATPYSSAFGTSNLADSVSLTPGYDFLSSTSSALSVVGLEEKVLGTMVSVTFNNPIIQLNFPANYMNVDGGSVTANVPPVSFNLIPGTDSAKGVVYVTYADTIDAWGSLTTPLLGGTTYSVLREKHYELDIDSIYMHYTVGGWVYFAYGSPSTKVYEYRWYTNTLNAMVASMDMDTNNKQVDGINWYNGLPASVNEVSQAHSTLVYPNPATSQINFKYSAQNAQNIFIYDITGRELGQAEMNNGAATLSTSTYASGIYFYHVTDKSGNVLDNGKFSVL